MDAISNALSGLRAASNRIAGVASNIANAGDVGAPTPSSAGDTAYQPVDTVEISTSSGGTDTSYRPSSPVTRPAYSPDSAVADATGMVAEPAVDMTQQTFDLIDAREAYKANLKTMQAANQMQRSLLDVVA
jgi:flagellar basal-body rod protein FlgC